MHNTTWTPHTMLNSRKKNKKSQFQGNFLTEGRTDLIHRTLLCHGHGSKKRINRSRVNDVDIKNKI